MPAVRELALLSATGLADTTEACRAVIEVLKTNRQAVPFAGIWLLDEHDRHYVEAVASYGMDGVLAPRSRVTLVDTHVARRVIETGRTELLTWSRAEAEAAAFEPSPLGPVAPDALMALPLTLLIDPLRQLLDAHRHELSDDERERLQAAHRAALRLERLVDGLLELSRAEGGALSGLAVTDTGIGIASASRTGSDEVLFTGTLPDQARPIRSNAGAN